ncbi:MAG TPA: hypothetical protein VMZ91_01395 [Candidatus Paceibacterota bacterium]|nr:hypothetical protein [Candidatus Paceibacterota bacterium]
MERVKNKPLTDKKAIKALIKEAKKRGFFNSKDVEPVGGYFCKNTMGIETARYNYYAMCNSPGDYLEVCTYKIDKKGNKVEDGYITIYSNGRWGKTKTDRTISKVRLFINWLFGNSSDYYLKYYA